MMDALITSLAGFFGFLLFTFLTNIYDNKRQQNMENRVKDIKKKEQELNLSVKKQEDQTQEKLNELTNEQNKKITSSELVDFFNNHKGK